MSIAVKKCLMVIFILIYASANLRLGECRQQAFVANTNFDNVDRWNEHGYPCAGDRIIFPPEKAAGMTYKCNMKSVLSHVTKENFMEPRMGESWINTISVFVQIGATISEMVLPMNGEFIFDDDVTWGVSTELSTCTHVENDHDVHFSSEPDSWYEYANWESSSTHGTVLGSQDLLDIEKVPCDFDDANFPSSNSFTVEIGLDAVLRSIRVAEQNFDTSGFAEYRNGDGRYKFIGSGSTTIDSRGCQDQSGCLCRDQTNLETVFATICSYTKCKQTPCENPILAFGSCCSVCGSMIIFNYTTQYTETAMTEFLLSYTSKPENTGIHTVLSKINSRMLKPKVRRVDEERTIYDDLLANDKSAIQILTTDESGTGEDAKRLADEFYDSMISNEDLGVSHIKMQSSGSSVSNGLSAGAIAGIAIGSIFGVILLLIVLYGIRSGPLRGKKYKMDFQLDDGRSENYGFTNITEVGPGAEFESSDNNPNIPKSSKYSTEAENIGWPQRSAMDSDFGVSFGNPAYDGDDL